MLCGGFKSVSEAAFCLYVSLSLHVILGKLFINFFFFFFCTISQFAKCSVIFDVCVFANKSRKMLC